MFVELRFNLVMELILLFVFFYYKNLFDLNGFLMNFVSVWYFFKIFWFKIRIKWCNELVEKNKIKFGNIFVNWIL